MGGKWELKADCRAPLISTKSRGERGSWDLREWYSAASLDRTGDLVLRDTASSTAAAASSKRPHREGNRRIDTLISPFSRFLPGFPVD